MLVRACARAGFTPRIVLVADDLFTVAGAVAAGIGVSVLPGRMIDYSTSGLRMLPILEQTPTTRTVSLAFRTGSVHHAALEQLRVAASAFTHRAIDVPTDA